MASTTSDTGDASSKQQQAQRKENYNKSKRPVHQSITAILTKEKREEKQFTKPTHVAVYLFRDLSLVCVCVCVCVCARVCTPHARPCVCVLLRAPVCVHSCL